MSEISDEQLMLSYRDGRLEAFETLYARHKGPLFRYILRGCGDTHVSEEIFQEIWIGLIKARERYKPEAGFKTYLYKLAHNRLIDHYRRSRLHVVGNSDLNQLEDQAPDAARLASDLDCVELMRQSLGHLPPEQREAFVLREETDMTLEQIGELSGVGRETIKSRIRYALKQLRTMLEECL